MEPELQCATDLFSLGGIDLVQLEDVADLGQRVTETLAAQYELEAGAVTFIVEALAGGRFSLRGEETALLVVTDRPRRYPELVGQFGNRERVIGLFAG